MLSAIGVMDGRFLPDLFESGLTLILINRRTGPKRDPEITGIDFCDWGLKMEKRSRAHFEKLKSGDAVSRPLVASKRKGFSHELRQHVAALGPTPKENLEVFVDLGCSDGEMARCFNVPETYISKLCHIWGIR